MSKKEDKNELINSVKELIAKTEIDKDFKFIANYKLLVRLTRGNVAKADFGKVNSSEFRRNPKAYFLNRAVEVTNELKKLKTDNPNYLGLVFNYGQKLTRLYPNIRE